MIDIKLVRDNPDVVRRSQQARGEDPAIIDAILAADETRRSSLAQFEAARAEQKSFGKQVAAAAPADKPALLAQVKDLAERVKALDAAAATAGEDAVRLLASVPNVVLDGVPTGGEEDYVVRETVGTPRISLPRASSPATTSRWGSRSGPSTSSAAPRSPVPGSTSSLVSGPAWSSRCSTSPSRGPSTRVSPR